MASQLIDVSAAKLTYGTEAEILALTGTRGDVGFVDSGTNQGTEYTNTDSGTTWIKTRSSESGAAFVTIKDSLAEIETPGAGVAISNTASSQQSSAITGTAVDISTDSTDDVFIAIGSNPTSVADTGYHIASNQSYRFKITSGYKVAVIATGTNGKTWIHPVA